MDKANVISNLRMGIAAGTVVLSGAVNEAEAARPAANAHPLLSEYALIANGTQDMWMQTQSIPYQRNKD